MKSDAIDLIEGLQSENRKLRELNAELLTFIKDALAWYDQTSGQSDFEYELAWELIAKAEGKCAG